MGRCLMPRNSQVIVPSRKPRSGEKCVCGRPAVRVLLLSTPAPQCAVAASWGTLKRIIRNADTSGGAR